MKKTDYVICEKNSCEVFFLSLSRKLESFKSNAWRFVLELIKWLSVTVCGVPQPIDLSTAIPHPLWRRNKHPNRVFDGVPIQFVSSNKKTIDNTGSRYEDRINWYQSFGFFLFGLFILSLLIRVNLESKKKICFLSFVSFLFIGFRFVNFCLGFITFVSCLCSCSCASEPSLGVRVSSHKFGGFVYCV